MLKFSAFIGLMLLPASLHAADAPPAVPLPGSIQPASPHVIREKLTAKELAQPIHFEVALRLRNFAELQQRVGRGEHISATEMAARYHPTAADYRKVIDWLAHQGFAIQQRDPTRMAVLASGSVGRIQKAFSMKFARVEWNGANLISAITPPVVPAQIAPLILGINGLQPQLRMQPLHD